MSKKRVRINMNFIVDTKAKEIEIENTKQLENCAFLEELILTGKQYTYDNHSSLWYAYQSSPDCFQIQFLNDTVVVIEKDHPRDGRFTTWQDYSYCQESLEGYYDEEEGCGLELRWKEKRDLIYHLIDQGTKVK